jgi:hypothetical protein
VTELRPSFELARRLLPKLGLEGKLAKFERKLLMVCITGLS